MCRIPVVEKSHKMELLALPVLLLAFVPLSAQRDPFCPLERSENQCRARRCFQKIIQRTDAISRIARNATQLNTSFLCRIKHILKIYTYKIVSLFLFLIVKEFVQSLSFTR